MRSRLRSLPLCSAPGCVATLALLYFTSTARAAEDHVLDDSHKYVTRPDIEAPKWNITIYDEARISPGYWFVPSYDYLDQSLVNGGKWTAPHIYDGDGKLVWSGSYLSQQYDIFDFRISNVLGDKMLTMMYPQNRSAYVLDSAFNMVYTFPIAQGDEQVNMHDLHFVNNGTRVLVFYDMFRNMTTSQSEDIGFTDWDCGYVDNCFRELDVTSDWETVFEWCGSDHIPFDESTKTEESVEDRCKHQWDYTHVNSLDKFADGSYLMSGRHTNTIYKIGTDGDIIWRLGGTQSDFDADFDFNRQHHARIVSENSTHTILSFFDNATDQHDKPASSESSRGMMVVLETSTSQMTASLLHEFHHPDGPGSYTIGRADMQVLPNGNVFICWVDGLLQSEYTPDGTIVMEARVKQNWLKSYRSYKFPFVGRPHLPPDVSATLTHDSEGRGYTTKIYVSWNGATEVRTWNIYRADEKGDIRKVPPIATTSRTGFEMTLKYDGLASYVVAEALDRHGQILGRSKVAKTTLPLTVPEALIEAEAASWRAAARPSHTAILRAKLLPSRNRAVEVFIFCVVAGVALGYVMQRRRSNTGIRARWKEFSYHRLASQGESC